MEEKCRESVRNVAKAEDMSSEREVGHVKGKNGCAGGDRKHRSL